MIIINDIHLPLNTDFSRLEGVAARELKIIENLIESATLYRKSVDARHKNDVHFCCSLLVKLSISEKAAISRCKKAQLYTEQAYQFPELSGYCGTSPVVIGFGPAGMFAALTLARAGMKPIVIERGEDSEKRSHTVESFQNGGKLDPESNVQFGEGGAGTFSDGKLNTGIKDIRCRAILKEFVNHGAPENILSDAKPHIGTDRLITAVKGIREEIISLGGEVWFSSCARKFGITDGRVTSVEITQCGQNKIIPCDSIILAIGHSARDTFEMLFESGIKLERKPFAMGVRIEHLQSTINCAMYGSFAGNKALGAADYKLAEHLENGRGVYTFCMCPGGYVINASSEPGAIAVNGMSYNARDGKNANSAVLAGISPDDFPGDSPLEGIYFQREIEQRAYSIANGAVPVQSVGSLIFGEKNAEGSVIPTVKPATVRAALSDVYPEFIVSAIKEGISRFGKKIKGFDAPDAVITFPETRSSSPVRITRGENGCSVSLGGLYPCGEGAGYAGGIMSAATDGIRTAEKLIDNLR